MMMLSKEDRAACLALLRQADEILMAAGELMLAAHLSLVIERLKTQRAGA